MTGSRSPFRSLLVLGILASFGFAAAGYVLVQQRLRLPFRDTYEVRAVLPAADGVAPGFGQAVNVSGVKVGTISEADLKGSRAHVTFEIQKKKLPEVYRDARADLLPITPLKDMRVELSPGTEDAGVLPDGGSIAMDKTSSPVPLSDLLSTLDSDTRTFLTTLVHGLGEGTKDRAPDMREILRAFGPTTAEVRRLTTAIDARRKETARVVRNVAAVAEAAESDGELAKLVASGERALLAVGEQEQALRGILDEAPEAFAVARSSLAEAGGLADELGPAAKALLPAVKELPAALKSLTPLAQSFTTLSRTELRPLVRAAHPLAEEVNDTVHAVSGILPQVSSVAQMGNFILNELAYNPPGRDEGGLFWMAWAFHNFSSVTNFADAHGAMFRAILLLNCSSMTSAADIGTIVKGLTGSASACPGY